MGTPPFSDCAVPQKLGQFFTEMEEKRRKQGNGPKGLLLGPFERAGGRGGREGEIFVDLCVRMTKTRGIS